MDYVIFCSQLENIFNIGTVHYFQNRQWNKYRLICITSNTCTLNSIRNDHVDIPVPVRSSHLSNVKPGQYQISDYLEIPGALNKRTLTLLCKNLTLSSPLIGIYMQLKTVGISVLDRSPKLSIAEPVSIR